MSARIKPPPLTHKTKGPAADHILARLSDPAVRAVPKYVRFQDVLIEAIKDGYWKPGDKLPTEKQLAATSRLSVGTVQRALRNLVEQGMIVRQQGLASFVAEMPQRVEQPWHCRFLNDNGTGVLPVYSKVIKRHLVDERGRWNEYVGSDGVFCIERRLNIGDEFSVFGRFYAARAVLGYFWDCSLKELNSASFRSLVTRACRLPITALAHNLKLMRFSEDMCRRLDIKPHSTGLYLYAVARSGRNFIYYQEFFIPPSQRFLHFSDNPERDFFAA